MPVPHIFAGSAGGTTAQLDANFAYLAALRDLFTISGGGAGFGGTPVAPFHLFGVDATLAALTRNVNVLSVGAAALSLEMGCLSGTTPTTAVAHSATLDGAGTGGTWSLLTRTGGTLTEKMRADNTGLVRPGTDAAQSFGAAGARWSVIFASTGTINTSDAREKTAVRPLTPAELAASKALAAEVGAYKFLSAIAAKGEAAARLHIGMTVQRVIEVMEAHGLDPFAYGFVCYDEWPADGDEPSGDRYSLRQDEMLLFIARGFDARLAALEAA